LIGCESERGGGQALRPVFLQGLFDDLLNVQRLRPAFLQGLFDVLLNVQALRPASYKACLMFF
jgi:hypothetical protein